jgi:hypothetical protein
MVATGDTETREDSMTVIAEDEQFEYTDEPDFEEGNGWLYAMIAIFVIAFAVFWRFTEPAPLTVVFRDAEPAYETQAASTGIIFQPIFGESRDGVPHIFTPSGWAVKCIAMDFKTKTISPNWECRIPDSGKPPRVSP